MFCADKKFANFFINRLKLPETLGSIAGAFKTSGMIMSDGRCRVQWSARLENH